MRKLCKLFFKFLSTKKSVSSIRFFFLCFHSVFIDEKNRRGFYDLLRWFRQKKSKRSENERERESLLLDVLTSLCSNELPPVHSHNENTKSCPVEIVIAVDELPLINFPKKEKNEKKNLCTLTEHRSTSANSQPCLIHRNQKPDELENKLMQNVTRHKWKKQKNQKKRLIYLAYSTCCVSHTHHHKNKDHTIPSGHGHTSRCRFSCVLADVIS